MAPSVAPAGDEAEQPLALLRRDTSTIIAQNTETTNRLNTEIQIKKARPIQIVCALSANQSASAKSRMLAAKKR